MTFVKAAQNLTTVNFQVMSVLVQYTDPIAEFGWDAEFSKSNKHAI